METINLLQPELINSFNRTAQYIFVPTNEDECDQLIALLDELTDIVRDDESHPLANMMDVVGVLIENYETQYFIEPQADPIATLIYFMQEQNLETTDLPELGDPHVVSDLLSGKRLLNLRQAYALSQRFNVPAEVFVGDVSLQSDLPLEATISSLSS